ncbi:ABC transporter ATP-binding protein [Desulfotomaculum copahuensis]|uniref:Sugar ABC transporter ATP-binding protein n=1 Tax=Desulfotomaculum copahuensis TaxID=1838280 RepID=A0A1B7LF84_9FIRM|nr:ABC transporter ATP-binding protein [Desulfotomaculum copahuensis]OAT82311.1 sugar ABC transporter ATP-binding protein [Desulfotomaculum copahuensis]
MTVIAESIQFEAVTKNYGRVTALREFNLEVAAGERMVLLGPSGCGKTTALRLVAGLEEAGRGKIYFGDRSVNDLPPGERGVAMVFQNYALYPHMTVAENMAFGLKMRRVPPDQIKARIDRAASMLGLEELLLRRPRELSGGQRQRAALGRAIVKEAPFFLLDEPLSNLDAQLRARARAELVSLHRQIGSTMLYVTHDQVEAMTVGQRIAVIAGGELQQVDTPERIYHRPMNAFVARFIGNPPMNLMPVKVAGNRLRMGGVSLQLPAVWAAWLAERPQGEITLGIRPEDLVLRAEAGPAGCSFPVRLTWQEDLGAEAVFYLQAAGELELVVRGRPGGVNTGDTLWVEINWERVHFFDGPGRSLGRPQALDRNDRSGAGGA